MDSFVCTMKSSYLLSDTCHYRQWTFFEQISQLHTTHTDLSFLYILLQVIDSDELEKMLDLVAQQGSSLMYTKSEVKDKIFRKIDLDNTNSIDFFECIEVSKEVSICKE